MMTGGAQARLRPPLIPLFPREIKDEKRNEGKREEHVKNVKRFAGEAEKSYLWKREQYCVLHYNNGLYMIKAEQRKMVWMELYLAADYLTLKYRKDNGEAMAFCLNKIN